MNSNRDIEWFTGTDWHTPKIEPETPQPPLELFIKLICS